MINSSSAVQMFLNNGDNKERLFEVIVEVWTENNHLLGNRVIFFARKDKCTQIDGKGSTAIEELSSDHEEADTKVVYLLKHAIEKEEDLDTAVFVVRSSSGDVDIPVILLANDLQTNATIILDNGRDKFRKVVHLSNCRFSDSQKKALLGFHAFTGCDQISSFLRKGKISCWKVLKNNPCLFKGFIQLGSEKDINDDLVAILEDFVCKLYGEKNVHDVDQARRNIF